MNISKFSNKKVFLFYKKHHINSYKDTKREPKIYFKKKHQTLQAQAPYVENLNQIREILI